MPTACTAPLSQNAFTVPSQMGHVASWPRPDAPSTRPALRKRAPAGARRARQYGGRPRWRRMSPTRYSDPVTSTCSAARTRRKIGVLFYSTASRRLGVYACARLPRVLAWAVARRVWQACGGGMPDASAKQGSLGGVTAVPASVKQGHAGGPRRGARAGARLHAQAGPLAHAAAQPLHGGAQAGQHRAARGVLRGHARAPRQRRQLAARSLARQAAGTSG